MQFHDKCPRDNNKLNARLLVSRDRIHHGRESQLRIRRRLPMIAPTSFATRITLSRNRCQWTNANQTFSFEQLFLGWFQYPILSIHNHTYLRPTNWLISFWSAFRALRFRILYFLKRGWDQSERNLWRTGTSKRSPCYENSTNSATRFDSSFNDRAVYFQESQ